VLHLGHYLMFGFLDSGLVERVGSFSTGYSMKRPLSSVDLSQG
jgi:hypothetical protein